MRSSRRTKRAARQLFRFCMVDGLLNETLVRRVAEELATTGRRDALPTLTELYRLVRLDRQRHTAVIESAVPLSQDQRDTLATDVARRYGSDVAVSFREDPALIGGVRIKVGSDVYDSSVRTRLAELEARL